MPAEWVLLSYRMPREPSTPRIAVWRRLKSYGVAQLGDGLVTLPADGRTREQFDWLAQEIVEHGGAATVWLARPATRQAAQELEAGLNAERAAEYEHVRQEAGAARELPEPQRRGAQRRLRAELHRIDRRNYFSPVERVRAHEAVEAIVEP